MYFSKAIDWFPYRSKNYQSKDSCYIVYVMHMNLIQMVIQLIRLLSNDCIYLFRSYTQIMNLVDNFKLRCLIQQSITSLKFLDHVKVQDDISSQLAGFQISKLLKNQQDNQLKYADLVKKRATLTQITQKKELQQVQAQIANLSIILKQSTKKLCKLFKENPDLQRDSWKVSRQRRTLISKLDELIELIKNQSTGKFQTFITQQLESQDQMRRLMEKQKNLNIDIKKIQQQKMAESKEYQKQIAESQAKIQEHKETLMQRQQRTQLQISYREKQSKAELSNQRRIFQLSEKALRNQIQNLKSSVQTQFLVHKELDEYLNKKKQEIKKKSEELGIKTETCKQNLENQINSLGEQIQQVGQQLEVYKKKYQQEEQRKMERERQQRNKLLDKQRKEQQSIRLDNAIKYIQNEYLAWKQAGGGKKKKKKK